MNIELRKTVASALDNSDLNMDQRKAKGFDTGCIANARPGSFSDAFFFSIEILATVGY